MPWPSFSLPNFKDRTLSLAFSQVETILRSLIARTHLDSQIIQDVTLATGTTNLVPHGLKRPLRGWTVVRRRADVRVWDSQDTGLSPELFIYLEASAAVVVDLEVF